MELLFKVYADKPSRLGVTYMFDYQAVNAYELLLSKGKGLIFNLKLEIIKDKMKLVLTSDENGYSTLYKDVDFKQEQARKLLLHINHGHPLQFVHIYKEGNEPFVAKPFKKQTFITVAKTDLIVPGSYGDQ